MWVQGQLCPKGTVDPSVRPDPHPRFSEHLSEERACLAGPPPAPPSHQEYEPLALRVPSPAPPALAWAGGQDDGVWGWEGRVEARGADTVVL